MYQQGWTNDRLGLASATAWTMFVIILLAVGLNALITRRRTRRDGTGSFVPRVTPPVLEEVAS
jgi:ABC-type sugar transport system permease subunit